MFYTLDGAINCFLSRFTCFLPVRAPASRRFSAGRAMFEDGGQDSTQSAPIWYELLRKRIGTLSATWHLHGRFHCPFDCGARGQNKPTQHSCVCRRDSFERICVQKNPSCKHNCVELVYSVHVRHKCNKIFLIENVVSHIITINLDSKCPNESKHKIYYLSWWLEDGVWSVGPGGGCGGYMPHCINWLRPSDAYMRQ